MLKECTEGVDSSEAGLILVLNMRLLQQNLMRLSKRWIRLGLLCISDEKYFAFRMRGVYDVRGNSMFLNEFYIDQPMKMIQVIRHEGWHAAQDCMAGTLDNFTALIHPCT